MKKYISLFVLLSILTLGIPKAEALISLNKSPVISGISGPQSLNVGEAGTWEIKAYDPNGGNLSYSVFWGDEVMTQTAVSNAKEIMLDYRQTSTFSHVYERAGSYTPVFTVRNDAGKSITTSLSLKVKGTSINPTTIRVISPNGGEVWEKGTMQTITWKVENPKPLCSELGLKCPDIMPTYEISLLPNYHCDGNICAAIAIAPTKIAKGVTGNSYLWTVDTENQITNSGSYKIMVCNEGGVCDTSNNSFRIVSSSDDFVISDVTGPKLLKIGQVGTWKVKVNDNDGGNLSYSVDWGDNYQNDCGRGDTPCARIIGEAKAIEVSQSATFTHAYSLAGTYQAVFTVTNEDGESRSETVQVTVRNLESNSQIHFGVLKPQEMNTTTMWGTHILSGIKAGYCFSGYCPFDSQSYLLKASNDSVLKKLIKYENRRVKITGILNWYDLEGGFWGIVVTKVTPMSNIWDIFLKKGMKGDSVLEIQNYLNRQGFNLKADSSFGPKTEKAIKEFQTAKGISPSGIVDGTTMNSLIGEQ